MIRGTTPILTFKINTELDLNDVNKARLTFESEYGTKEKTWDETRLAFLPEENKIQLQLTQEETLYFSEGKIEVQLKIKLNNGMVYGSDIKKTTLDKILNEEVI